MLARWTVEDGPELAESLDACNVPEDRLELHLRAFRLRLERNPFIYSEPFAGHSRRVLETIDLTGEGFRLTGYAVLHEGLIARLMWIEAHPLEPDEDP